MNDKTCMFDILNNIDKIKSHNETSSNTELLEFFVTYVHMTNPDYTYNESYLRDMIPEFWENVKRYKARVEFRERLFNEIKKIEISEEHKCFLFVQIDEIWELKHDTMKEGSELWRKEMLENPNIKVMDKKEIYVKCRFINGHSHSFSGYLISTDKDKLVEFVKDSIKLFSNKLEDKQNG